jgi:hypothetical protein
MDPRERNRLANIYAKEKNAREIGSPFRVKVYVDARLKGKSPEKALEAAKRGK